MARDSFVSWYKMFVRLESVFEAVPDENAGRALKASFVYARTGEVPELDALSSVLFAAIKPSIDDSAETFENIKKRNRENGKRGGRPPVNRKNQEEPKETPKTQTNPDNPNNPEKAEDRSKKIEDRSKKTEVRSQKKEVREIEREPANAGSPPAPALESGKDAAKPKKKNTKAEQAKAVADVFGSFAGTDTELLKTLDDYAAQRKENKRPLTARGAEILCNRLDRLTDEAGVHNRSGYMMAVLEQSILRGWDGVWEYKDTFQDTTAHITGNTEDCPREITPESNILDFL